MSNLFWGQHNIKKQKVEIIIHCICVINNKQFPASNITWQQYKSGFILNSLSSSNTENKIPKNRF
jgi:hypothetical protein